VTIEEFVNALTKPLFIWRMANANLSAPGAQTRKTNAEDQIRKAIEEYATTHINIKLDHELRLYMFNTAEFEGIDGQKYYPAEGLKAIMDGCRHNAAT
jgi:hypothetical protein